jgi:hypothetical protein
MRNKNTTILFLRDEENGKNLKRKNGVQQCYTPSLFIHNKRKVIPVLDQASHQQL